MKNNTSKNISRTDLNKLAHIPEKDIDLSDIPELDEDFFRHAELRLPKTKEAISLRVDQDVLTWFRNQGKGYQTRMNAGLRTYMNAHAASK